MITRATAHLSRHFQARRSLSTLPDTMRGVMVTENGDADVLQLQSVPLPKLEDGQCLIKNEVAGVNFIDTYFRRGLYPREPPFISGQEGGGIVAAVTPAAAAQGVKEGDRVVYSVLDSYCEFSAVDASKVIPVPSGLDTGSAVACIVQGLTAHYLTTDAHANLIQPGQWCLLHAAAGGTGQLALQMAKKQGFRVIATCSSGKMDIARELGADVVLDSRTDDLVDRVMEITDEVGVHCAIDGVGAATADVSLGSLAVRGICIFFGNASGVVPPVDPLQLVGKSNFITRPKLMDYTRNRQELLARADEVLGWARDGSLKVNIDCTFPLEESRQAHEYLEAGKTTGKVLITM